MKLEPAHSIVKKLGGAGIVADITGLSRVQIYRWQYPRQKGGTGGTIPYSYVETLLAEAKSKGVALEPSDFFPAQQAAE